MYGQLFHGGSFVARFLEALSAPARQHKRSRRDDDFISCVRATVQQHLSDPTFTTTSAAAILAISRMHLNRRLRALTGNSTHEFIRQVRLDAARDRLLETNLSVTAIACEVGYKSVSHFGHAFRQRFGVNPSEFRRLESARTLLSPADCPI